MNIDMIYWKKLGDLERALSLFLQKIKVFVKILFLMARLPRFNRSGMPYYLGSPSKTIFLLVKLEFIQQWVLVDLKWNRSCILNGCIWTKAFRYKEKLPHRVCTNPVWLHEWCGAIITIITYKDNKCTIATVASWLYR